jgi:hypothetical protein
MTAWPAPEVPQRPADDHEIPRGAKTLIKAARQGNWQVEVLYSRGYWPHSGEPVLSELVSVRFVRARLRGFALYLDGRFEAGWRFDPDDPNRWRRCKATELKNDLQQDPTNDLHLLTQESGR